MAMLFVTPLKAELDFLAQGLRDNGHEPEHVRIGRLDALRFPALGILAARGGHGKTQFGVQTQHLLDHVHLLEPAGIEAVVCAGAAGAIASHLAVGDLVVATETVEHDYTERFRPHPLPRFAGDADLLAALRGLQPAAHSFALHFDIVASGDEDVIELERGAALREATEACAVAWEGAGGARASAFNGVPYIELRGITDTADHNAVAHFDTNLHLAMANIALLVTAWRGTAVGNDLPGSGMHGITT